MKYEKTGWTLAMNVWAFVGLCVLILLGVLFGPFNGWSGFVAVGGFISLWLFVLVWLMAKANII